ncbi:MAG: hypothetical protein ACYTFT_16535 [Planctomycetota bacterium]
MGPGPHPPLSPTDKEFHDAVDSLEDKIDERYNLNSTTLSYVAPGEQPPDPVDPNEEEEPEPEKVDLSGTTLSYVPKGGKPPKPAQAAQAAPVAAQRPPGLPGRPPGRPARPPIRPVPRPAPRPAKPRIKPGRFGKLPRPPRNPRGQAGPRLPARGGARPKPIGRRLPAMAQLRRR